MWRRFRASGLPARLLLFVVFLGAMGALRACLADTWRAGEERAGGVAGGDAPAQAPPPAGQAEP
jgi:hypothetical protein